MVEKIKCPVCGKYEFEEEGDFDICENCGWQNDPLQMKDANYRGGANKESLNEAKKIYAETGKYEKAFPNK